MTDLHQQRAFGVLPLRNLAIFPGTRTSLEVARPRSMALLESLRSQYSSDSKPIVVLVAQRDPATEEYPPAADLPQVGVAARILAGSVDPAGKYFIGVEALARVRIVSVASEDPFLSVRVQEAAAPPPLDRDAQVQVVRHALLRRDDHSPLGPDIPGPREPSALRRPGPNRQLALRTPVDRALCAAVVQPAVAGLIVQRS